jgi:hypothetical protein
VALMRDKRNAYKFLMGKSEVKISLGSVQVAGSCKTGNVRTVRFGGM